MTTDSNFEWFFLQFLKDNGISLRKIVLIHNQRFLNNTYNYENIRGKLKRHTISFVEIENLLQAIGYDIKFIRRKDNYIYELS